MKRIRATSEKTKNIYVPLGDQ